MAILTATNCASLPQYQRNDEENLHNAMEEKRISNATPCHQRKIRWPYVCSSGQNPTVAAMCYKQPLTLKSDTRYTRKVFTLCLDFWMVLKILGGSYNSLSFAHDSIS